MPYVPGPVLAGAPGVPDGHTGSEAGLQRNTRALKRAIEANFPEIGTIGGVREDALRWHPSGLALDVMVPNHDTPEGKALGDRIWNWVHANGAQYGFEGADTGRSIWRDGGAHENHLHLVTNGGGLPEAGEQITTADGMPIQLPNAQIMGPNGMPLPPGAGMPPSSIGSSSGSGSDSSSGLLGGLFPKLKDPTSGKDMPDNLQPANIASQVGGILAGLVGGFFGIDLSMIGDIAGKIQGGMPDEEGTGEADPSAQAEMDQYGQETPYGYDYSGTGTDLYGGENAAVSAYDPKGGAEQWRGLATSIVTQLAPQYGITNVKGWVDDIIGQIQHESSGNPAAFNGNDTDGKGGTQTVQGLGQFLKSTFDAHNITRGDISDPSAQIAAMVDYVSKKYGMDADGSPSYINEGHGYRAGGRVRGPGTTTSDSVPAWLSKDEHVTNAKSTNYYGHSLFDALNSRAIPREALGLAGGGWWTPLVNPQKPVGGIGTGLGGPRKTAPAPASGTPGGVGSRLGGSQPGTGSRVPPGTSRGEIGTALGAKTPPVSQMGEALGANLSGPGSTPAVGIGSGIGSGAPAPALARSPMPQAAAPGLGGKPSVPGGQGGSQPGADAPLTGQEDPRSAIGQAPASQDHLNPGIRGAIEGAAAAAGNAGAMAASMGTMGMDGGMGGSMISAGAQMAGQAISGVANVISSALVGTVSSGSTPQAYGVPMTPQEPARTGVPANPGGGGQTVNYGGVTVGNYDEFHRGEERRRAQEALPFVQKW
jgi:hypothetical protein